METLTLKKFSEVYKKIENLHSKPAPTELEIERAYNRYLKKVREQ